jgi:hypothetical protein
VVIYLKNVGGDKTVLPKFLESDSGNS